MKHEKHVDPCAGSPTRRLPACGRTALRPRRSSRSSRRPSGACRDVVSCSLFAVYCLLLCVWFCFLVLFCAAPGSCAQTCFRRRQLQQLGAAADYLRAVVRNMPGHSPERCTNDTIVDCCCGQRHPTPGLRPESPPPKSIRRRAIALGRLAIDPLAVLASLVGPKREILSLKLAELQGALQPDDLMRAYEHVLCTAVCQVRETGGSLFVRVHVCVCGGGARWARLRVLFVMPCALAHGSMGM